MLAQGPFRLELAVQDRPLADEMDPVVRPHLVCEVCQDCRVGCRVVGIRSRIVESRFASLEEWGFWLRVSE